ncbi:ammonia channel protein, partial [Mesorhizobium sp. M1A.T.Ca.IN.004.03.1.1]
MSISKFSSTFARVGAASAALLAPAVAFAQETAAPAAAAAAPAFTMDKGDNTWMLVSSALV